MRSVFAFRSWRCFGCKRIYIRRNGGLIKCSLLSCSEPNSIFHDLTWVSVNPSHKIHWRLLVSLLRLRRLMSQSCIPIIYWLISLAAVKAREVKAIIRDLGPATFIPSTFVLRYIMIRKTNLASIGFHNPTLLKLKSISLLAFKIVLLCFHIWTYFVQTLHFFNMLTSVLLIALTSKQIRLGLLILSCEMTS